MWGSGVRSGMRVQWLSVVGGAMSVSAVLAVGVAGQGPAGNSVRTVTDTLVGSVGGVAVDALGAIYVADFGERVYKVRPDGRWEVFVDGLYGTSGNAIDSRGRLIQSQFSGNSVARVDRDGTVSVVAEGLEGPVGVALGPEDEMYVCNCRSNTISRVSPDGEVTVYAESELFNCPNGITRDDDGTLYVVNFSDGRVLRVDTTGTVGEFAVLPGGGNGHIARMRGALYATSFQGHRLYRITREGEVTPFAGTGAIGEVDGPALEASFTFPNGIAVGPTGDRLYVNDFINRFPPTAEAPPVPLSTVRQVTLAAFWTQLAAVRSSGGIEAMRAFHRAWKSDPATAGIYTEIEVNAYGYALLQGGDVPGALALFELNTEAYPQSFNAWDSLAEAHAAAGDTEAAIRYYEKSLELNPGNTNARDKLAELRGGG
ncbi:MAG: tetratricopeptide repeat protein [Gemmatimonadetes bacterium]|nr:tetratricopeptide repeat protein [Gemmatimonadota bacterium]